MSNNEVKALWIARQLTLEHRADLLAWVHLAYTAENSARKSLYSRPLNMGASTRKLPEYSGSNILQRSKK